MQVAEGPQSWHWRNTRTVCPEKLRGACLLGQVDLLDFPALHCATCKALLKAQVASAGDYSPGDVLGQKYTVVEVIGRGSNAVTYRVLLAFSASSAGSV